MKILNRSKLSQGFTLIELIVVIAIIGILAAVLLVVIDPLDKINSANDTGVISTITQLGKANDAYAATHANTYVGPAGTTSFSAATTGPVADLFTAGESKLDKVTAPAGYTYSYLAGGAGCTTSGATKCSSYVFYVFPLKAKANSANTYFWYANGKGCFKTAAPVSSTDSC